MMLLKKSLKPEFLIRIDDIILFSPLTKMEIKKIVDPKKVYSFEAKGVLIR